MITVVYFAKIKDQLGLEKEEIEADFAKVIDLKNYLCARDKSWKEVIGSPDTQVAVNHEISRWQADLPKDAEVAFFPPITGG